MKRLQIKIEEMGEEIWRAKLSAPQLSAPPPMAPEDEHDMEGIPSTLYNIH